MIDINWENAPEGATHCYVPTRVWYKLERDKVFIYLKGDWEHSVHSTREVTPSLGFVRIPVIYN